MSKCIFLLILFFSFFSFAGEREEFFVGIRGLGMGGAQVATVNDETSLLVNPAALGKLRNYFITVADPELHLGADTQSILGLNVLAPIDPQKVLDLMNDGNQSKRLHAKLQIFPSAVFPNFGLGLFANYIVNSSMNTTTSELTYDYRSDLAMVFGFNFRFWDGIIKLGFNVKVLNRNEIKRTDLPANSTNLTIKNLTSEGVGISSDAGLLFTLPWKLLPTLGVVYRDAGGTHYTLRDGLINSATTKPEMTDSSLDAAFALFPIAGKRTRISFTGEYRDILNVAAENDVNRRIHTGIEFNFSDALFVRAGMNQRYWTAGLEIAVENYQLQLATYGEDVGADGTPEEARRYVGKFSYRF
ncbi:MAG: hypothetical protein H6625_02035 [Bdellovibrionaceae bacterium]|nr:hypothetical protein [Pseudobdellovibrionaceae bacterium]